MLFSNFTSTTKEKDSSLESVTDLHDSEEVIEAVTRKGSKPNSIVEYEEHYESQIQEILEDAIGLANVSVKVNVSSTEKQVYEKNRRSEKQITDETDREGGKRTIENNSIDEEVIVINNGDKETPLIIGTEKPKVTGVMVVAEGAESMVMKQQIIESVTRFLRISSHQVSVLGKKKKEE